MENNTTSKKDRKDALDFLRYKIIDGYSYSYIQRLLQRPVEDLRKWWKEEVAVKKELQRIKRMWSNKCKDSVKLLDFYKWYISVEKECKYCGIPEETLRYMYANNLFRTKRLKTRGKNLEIERISPNLHYSNLSNLALSCYWCNNAKSDEFSESEFKTIAREMKEVWKGRINSHTRKMIDRQLDAKEKQVSGADT